MSWAAGRDRNICKRITFTQDEWEQVRNLGLRVKMCVWLGVSRGLDLAFLNAD